MVRPDRAGCNPAPCGRPKGSSVCGNPPLGSARRAPPGHANAARKPQGRGDRRSRARASQGGPHGLGCSQESAIHPARGSDPQKAAGRPSAFASRAHPRARERHAGFRAPPPRPWPRSGNGPPGGIPEAREAPLARVLTGERYPPGPGLGSAKSGRKAKRLRLPSPSTCTRAARRPPSTPAEAVTAKRDGPPAACRDLDEPYRGTICASRSTSKTVPRPSPITYSRRPRFTGTRPVATHRKTWRNTCPRCSGSSPRPSYRK